MYSIRIGIHYVSENKTASNASKRRHYYPNINYNDFGILIHFRKKFNAESNFSWQSDVSSIAFNLEQQTVITHTWLANLEAGGNYYVSILDNNTPFLFNDRMNDTAFHDLVTDAWAYYYENGGALPENTISYRSRYKTFFIKKRTVLLLFCHYIGQRKRFRKFHAETAVNCTASQYSASDFPAKAGFYGNYFYGSCSNMAVLMVFYRKIVVSY